MDRSHLLTELRLAESMDLDRMPLEQAVELISTQDAVAVAAVAAERSQIVAAVKIVAAALASGGRLIYFGAGTSGRLGILDAAECPPTFGVSPDRVQAVIAGGDAAIFRAQEGAEDKADDGAAAVDAKEMNAADVAFGIAAGGTTPFVQGALRRARERGAKTIFLSCVQPIAGEAAVDVAIRPLTGPEVVTGSTRMKAGTATKLVLNAVTTLAMVQLGKVYENLMVDLRATNAKLRDRAARMVATVTGVTRDEAAGLLEQAGGHVKLAIAMRQNNLTPDAARDWLARNGNRLRQGGSQSAPRP